MLRAWRALRHLKSQDAHTRRNAIERLGHYRSQRAVEPLIAALKDDDYQTREVAARALGRIGDVRAVGALISTLDDEKYYVWTNTAVALEALGWQPTQDGHRARFAVAKGNWEEAARTGAAAVEPLKEVSWSSSITSSSKRDMARALGKCADPQLVPVLERLLNDDGFCCEGVRREAALALGQIGDERPTESLILRLKDKDHEVQLAAAQALGRIHTERSLEALALFCESAYFGTLAKESLYEVGRALGVKYLAAKLKPAKEEGADPRIRRALIEVLDKIGSDEDPEDIPSTAMPEFLDALTDEDSNVRKTAAVFLGKSGDPSVAPSLIDTLLKDESSSVRGEAVKALDKLDPGWRESENLTSAAPKFVASLNDEFFGKRRRAAEYLGIIRNKAATPHLVLALKDDDDDVREAAQNALSLIDIDWKQSEAARAAIPQFAAALKDSRGGVRANAAKVLGEIADPAGVEPLIKALSDDDVKVRHQAADALKKIGDPSSEQPLAEYYEAERAQREKNRQELAELQVALLPTGSMRPFALAAVKEALENLPKLEKTKWIKANSGKFGPVSPYSWPGTDRTFNSAEACIEELNKDSEEGKKVLWAPTTNSLIVEIHAESQHYSSYNTETLIERKIILRQADGSFYRFYTFIV